MGTLFSRQLDFLSLFHCKSKSRMNSDDQNIEELSTLNSTNFMSVNGTDISLNSIHFVEDFIPERYLVLLTEQMTEMLFCLMIYNDTSMMIPECDGFDHRTTLSNSICSGNTSVSGLNSPNDPISLQSQTIYKSCTKCKEKILTIEKFRELNH